jgi:hypothetical protein
MNHNLSIKLTKGNFMAWRTQILAYIKGQDAYGFLDGSSQPPAQTIPNPSTIAGAPATVVNPDFLAWNQRDQMILSILISTLSEPYVVHAVGSPSASSLWNTLLTMFASTLIPSMSLVRHNSIRNWLIRSLSHPVSSRLLVLS